MEIFTKRPFMACCTVFIIVSAISFFVRQEIKLAIIALAIILFVLTALMFLLKKVPTKLTVEFAVLLIALFAGALSALESYLYFDVYMADSLKRSDTPTYVEGIVIDVKSEYVFESSYVIRLSEMNGEETRGKACVIFDTSQEFKTGDLIRFLATKVSLKDICDSTGELPSLVSDGIRYAFTVSDEQNEETVLISEGNLPLLIFIESARRSLCAELEQSIGGESGRLSSALLFGERYALSGATRLNFSRSGIYHMLALSGLHLTILTGVLDFLFRKMHIHKLIRVCFMPFIIFPYLALTGFNLSTVRAAIMLTVVYLTFILAMPADSLTVLFFTGFSILLFSPASVADIGFWMSFLATFGIVIVSLAIYEKRNEKIIRKTTDPKELFARKIRRIVSKIVTALLVTFAANVTVLIFTWLCFGEISLATPVSNLLFSPLVTIHFILSLFVLILSPVPFVQNLFSILPRFTGDLLLSGTAFVSDIENVSVSLRYSFSGYIIIIMTVVVAIMLIIKIKHKILIAIPPVLAAIAYAVCVAVSLNVGASSSEMIYASKKDNDTIIITHNMDGAICDLSDGSYTNIREAWELAKYNGMTELKAFVLTHYHRKHINSVSRLASNAKIRRIALPYPKNQSEYAILEGIYGVAEENGIELYLYDYGTELTLFDEGKLNISQPLYIDRSVQPTFTLTYSFGSTSALYVSSSYPEADSKDYTLRLDSKDYVIYGTHGPLPKKHFELPNENVPSVIIFADEELFELSYTRSALSLFSSEILYGCKYKKFGFELQE